MYTWLEELLLLLIEMSLPVTAPILALLTIAIFLILTPLTIIDRVGVKEQSGLAVVVGKKIQKGVWVEQYGDGNGSAAGGGYYEPDTYELTLDIDDKQASEKVGEKFYHHVKEGQRIPVKYSIGRVTKSLYPHKIIKTTTNC